MIDNSHKTRSFVDLTGAISETFVPSPVQRSKILSVQLKFSDVLTQDALYIRRLDANNHVLEEYAMVLFEESATATRFTWLPPTKGLNIGPREKFQAVFDNNDGRTLTAKESNITYEFI